MDDEERGSEGGLGAQSMIHRKSGKRKRKEARSEEGESRSSKAVTAVTSMKGDR